MKKSLLLVSLILSLGLLGQNLVPNPSFEIYSSCPLSTDAFGVVANWGNPDTATPDYFNSCHTPLFPMFSVDVPQNAYGNELANTGNGYAGIVGYTEIAGFPTGGREYIMNRLTSPLLTGQTYCVSFYISLSDDSDLAIDNIGVYFSNSSVNLQTSGILPFTPQVEFTGLILHKTEGFCEMKMNYTAVGGEEYIIIGNFQPDNQVNVTSTGASSSFFNFGTYFYIDDVSVVAGPCSCDATITPVVGMCTNSPVDTLEAAEDCGIWSGNGIIDAKNGYFDPSVAGAGTHTVTYTLACDNNSIDIIVAASDTADFSYSQQIYCMQQANPIPVINGSTGGSFTIAPGTAVVDPNTGEIDLLQSQPGSYMVYYSFAGPCGGVDSVGLIIEDQSAVDFAYVMTTFCKQDTNPVPLILGIPGGVFTINNGGVIDSNTGVVDIGQTPLGTYEVKYIITGACAGEKTQILTIASVLDATITGPDKVCIYDGIDTLKAVTPGGIWSGPGVMDAQLGLFDPAIAGLGIHDVTYTISGSCAANDVAQVEVISVEDPSIIPVGPFCENTPSVELMSATSGGTWSGNGITDPVLGVFSSSVSGLGTHEIIYTIPGGCGSADTLDILVNGNIVYDFMYGDTVYCYNNPNPVPTVTGNTGGVFTINNGGTINANTGEIDILLTPPGKYEVTYTVNGLCISFKTIEVEIVDLGNMAIKDPGSICVEDSLFNIEASHSAGVWSGAGIADSITGAFDPEVAGVGTHMVYYAINYPCQIIDSIELTVHPQPDISSTSDTTLVLGESAMLSVTGSTGNYTWIPATFLDCSTCEEVETTPTSSIVYQVVLDDPNGCRSVEFISVRVIVHKSIFVPNLFSPNGDLNNEILYVRGRGIKTLEFKVYNRWGQKVFETTDIKEGWDGSFNDKKLNKGVFYYTLDVTYGDDTFEQLKGDIMLIR